jgi:hypothetical protein
VSPTRDPAIAQSLHKILTKLTTPPEDRVRRLFRELKHQESVTGRIEFIVEALHRSRFDGFQVIENCTAQ